ncbi:hypothetical protein BGZ63DRAFT_451830 [Mariannaea sp. PMI_226]|nr:hypothetical protein BGZ63DRAFT_451830 [Mariannaea sp. PMI_226]
MVANKAQRWCFYSPLSPDLAGQSRWSSAILSTFASFLFLSFFLLSYFLASSKETVGFLNLSSFGAQHPERERKRVTRLSRCIPASRETSWQPWDPCYPCHRTWTHCAALVA